MKLFQKKKKTVSQETLVEGEKPDKEEIERQFEILLDELAIPHGVKRDEMQNWDMARKWMLLSQKETPEKSKKLIKAVSTKSVHIPEDNPQTYINSLKSPQRDKHLSSLKVILTGKELSWAIVFLDLQGLECIMEILEDAVRATPKTLQKATEILDCIACIKTLLNSQIGMAKCMERPQFTKSVASVLSCTDELLNSADIEIWEKILCSALNILAAMCVVPNGHRMVVTAFNRLSEEYDEEERFACILKCIWNCMNNARRNNSLTENYYSLLLSCMSFINVVINAPHELRMRCALRSSIFAIGGEKVLQELRGVKDDTILAQIDTFYSTAEDDCAEFVGDKGFGEYLFSFYNVISELTQSLADKAKITTHQSIFYILNNLNQLLDKEDMPNCEFSLRELESQSHRVLLQLLYSGNHDAEEWVHVRSVSDPSNHATAVATLPWMPDSVRTRSNTIMARQLEEPEIQLAVFDPFSHSEGAGSPHLGPPPPATDDELLSLVASPPLSPAPSLRDLPPAPSVPTSPSSESPRPTTPRALTPPPSLFTPPVSSSPRNSRGPPPPPSMPAKKSPDTQFLPGVKMRNLQWKKVNEAELQNTIWSKPEFQCSGATSLFSAADYKALEDLFCENSNSVMSPRVGDSKETKRQLKVSLLDPKRSNNIAIMLSKIKIPPAEIVTAVEHMDASKLTSDQVGQMLKLVPTAEEESMLSSFPEQDRPNLGKPELYLLEIMRVPHLDLKLECWHFSMTYAAKVAELKMNTVVLSNASKQLMNSKKFSQLLLIILQLGNFMNAGGFRGAASGIKLDCLSKLRELKAGDKRQTLLHFLVNFCSSKQPELLSFFDEISFSEQAKNVSMQALQGDYASLCAGFSNLERHLTTLANEPFVQKLAGIALEAKAAHEQVKTEFSAAKSAYESTLAFFGEDVVSPEEFFGNIFRFHISFSQVVTEINRTNQTAQKRGRGGSTTSANVDKAGGQFLDNIITKIQDSKIFRSRSNISEIMVDSIPPRSLFVSS